MNKYKIIVRNSPDWRSHRAATFGVSIESPNWQDKKAASIFSWANKHFDMIRVDVTDALYRHNLMAKGLDPVSSFLQANALGALWLTKHQHIISKYASKILVVRWAEWYKHPDYPTLLERFHEIYNSNSVFYNAVEKDLNNFFSRRGLFPTPEERGHSRNYLIEEVAIITIQARELASVKVYPGDELNCFNVVRNGLVQGAPQGLEREKFVKIKFQTRPTHTPFNTEANFSKSFLQNSFYQKQAAAQHTG